ncbi:hypothetical protein ACIOEX_20520 [Streptomyces sp. NPDC087850]|uniref:hypothetical protein n=1 Tax=Streptomyces sp. NPDC087850 TaxID=3365809 RepID=UPI003805048C
MIAHQPVYHMLQGPLGVQGQAACACGWQQDLEDCGSPLRAYLGYADHLREDAVAHSRRTNSTEHDRSAA